MVVVISEGALVGCLDGCSSSPEGAEHNGDVRARRAQNGLGPSNAVSSFGTLLWRQSSPLHVAPVPDCPP